MQSAVAALVPRFIPTENASVIGIGIPAFGYAVAGVSAGDRHGLYAPYAQMVRGNQDDRKCLLNKTLPDACDGNFDYSFIVAHVLSQQQQQQRQQQPSTFETFYDEEAGGTWAFSESDAWTVPHSLMQPAEVYSHVFVSYADPSVVRAAAGLLRQQRLGSVIMWDVRSDLPADHPASLLATLSHALPGRGTLAEPT